jgi:hypothetical protein
MIRAAARLAFKSCVLASVLAIVGCAAPGEPTPRHPIVPVAVSDLSARQSGNSFALAFTLPTRSTDREALVEHPAIEIYRAELPPGGIPVKQTAWRLAYTIPPEQVDQYLKEEHFEFRDPLTAEDFSRVPGTSAAYKVRTRATRARASADSNIVTARIYPAPDSPREVHVEVTEPTLIVHWAAVNPPAGTSSVTYRVYRGVAEPGETSISQDLSKTKLKSPLELEGSSSGTEFRDVHFEFGTPYVYSVRSVAQYGADSVESADSVPTLVTPRDIFPPATPTGLEIAVIPASPQVPAYVELSWAISTEEDLAGYFVYRSDREGAPGERVNAEILPSPAFRDISVQPGKRYYYRVSALDRAGNESPMSSAVVADVP